MNVSIIIPAHNAAGTIGEALQSLLAQTHRDWEAIVVENGSTDETVAVTAGYAEKDSRIRLVRLPPVGVTVARNKGIELASFDWLYFLDADDWILPAFLERMTGELESDPGLDGVHCGWANTAPDGLKLDESYPTEKGDLFDVFAQRNIFTMHSCVVRRALVEVVGGFDGLFSITHDWDLWQRIARTGANFGLVHDVLVYYRMRPSSGWLDPASYLSQGIRVITNGHSRDPRVPNPAQAHVNGRPAERLAAAKLHFACWPAGMALGRGEDATLLLGRLAGVKDHGVDPLAVAVGIFYGVVFSRCQPPSVWGILWPDLEEKVDRFLDRLESLSGTLGLARGARSILDKLVAESSVEQLRARIEMLIQERDQNKNQVEILINERDQINNERDQIKNLLDERETLIARILRKPWVRLGLRMGLMKRPSELKNDGARKATKMAALVQRPTNLIMNVSVIIPAFNAADTIGETLQSLQAQTFKGWEAVVVDDGSTDHTREIAMVFAEKDPRIRVVSQTNGGESAARNKGISRASFDWLYFLDSDDWVVPTCLERLTDALAADAALDAVHCGWTSIAPDGAHIWNNISLETGDLFNVFACRNIFPVHTCMVRRSLVESVGAFDLSFKICADWDIWQRIARAGGRFGAIPDLLAYYRFRPEATWFDAEKYLAHGFRIVKQGHSPDPRVPSAVPAHRDGLPKEDLPRSLYRFACWPAGIALGRGKDARPLLDALDGMKHPGFEPELVAEGIFYGAMLPRCQPPGAWEGFWPIIEQNAGRFLDALEKQSGAAGLADRVRSILEKMIEENSVEKLRARIEMLNSRVDEQNALIERVLNKPWVRLGLQLGLMKRPSELKQRMALTRGQVVKRKFDQRALILMYHRVTEVRPDPWDLCVTPKHFAEHLEVLRGQAHPLSLTGLLESLDKGSLHDRTVVVTFDDGYADNLHQAKPLLERHGIPATFFLSSGCIGRDREFWWDELERLLFQPGTLPETLHLEISGSRRGWDLGEAAHWSADDVLRHRGWKFNDPHPNRRHQVFREIYQLLQPLPANEQWKVLEQIRAWTNVKPATRPTHRTLSSREAIDLAQGGLVEIGSHTVTHPVLSALTIAAQRDELERSKSDLEKLLNCKVTCFAYPYGGSHVYTTETVRAVRESGFQGACTTNEGIVHKGTDRFQLPRVMVFDWDGETFAGQLSRWFEELKDPA